MVLELKKMAQRRTSCWLMLLNFVHNELANGSVVILMTSYSLLPCVDQTDWRVQHIVQKFSISLSILLSSLFVLFPISLHTHQEITMTCVLKPGKVAAAGRKLFALRFLFLSSPYVISKLSDFFCLFR